MSVGWARNINTLYGDRKFVTVFTTARNEAVCPPKPTLLAPMFKAELLRRSFQGIYYVFFWVVPRRLNYICRRFGTIYLFHLHPTCL